MSEKQPPQYLFISQRDIVVASTRGHAIGFTKGKPVHVPRSMHSEVMEKGCLPCDKEGKILDAPEAIAGAIESKVVLVEPEDAEEREAKITEAMKAIVKRNNPHDFSAGGVPSAMSLTAILGWRVDQKEVRPIWNKMKPDLDKG